MKFTLLQVMKLVVAGAAASMVLAPIVRLGETGAIEWSFVALLGAMLAPLALAVLAFPLARRGPGKDRLVRVLLMAPCGAGLLAGLYSLFLAPLGPRAVNVWATTSMDVATVSALTTVMTVLFALLLPRVLPRKPQGKWHVDPSETLENVP